MRYWEMKNIISILCLAFVLSACSLTSGVPEDDQLYAGISKITYENYEGNDHAEKMKEEVETSLAIAPNGALLGSSYHRFPFPFNLWIWNGFHDSESGFGKWIASSFGKEPVLMSRVNPVLRTTVAQSVLRSHGYFHSTVSHEIQPLRNPKSAKIGYTVDMGHLWTLDSIRYEGFSEGCDTLIQNTLDETKIHRGDPFDVTTLSEERTRISNLLRTNGYYYYQPSYSNYLADTLAVPGQVQLRFKMSDDVPEQAKHQWYIGKVDVEFRKQMMEPLDSVRKLRSISIAFNGKRPPVRPRVVMANMRLRSRSLYSLDKHQESVEKMSAMGIFSTVNFRFTPRDSTPECDTLDLRLNCVFERPYDFYVETRAAGSSVGRLGPELVVGLAKRNAFHGGEKLDIALHGMYAWQLNGGTRNYYEYGYDLSVEYPRLVAPFFGGNRPQRGQPGRRRRRFYTTPTTTARLSNNVINRPGYLNLNTLTAEWIYRWQTSACSRYMLSPFTLQYQFKNRVSDELDEIMYQRSYFSSVLEDKLVPQIRFTYLYTSPANYLNPIKWETTVSEAGNLVSLAAMAFGRSWNEQGKKIYKTSYSQFLKIETDFTKTWSFGMHNSVVAHVNLGYLPTYGNSDIDDAPFSEYFYVGGATSLRAWPLRDIGPADWGGMKDEVMNRYTRYLRVGTIKAVASLEYRPRLFGNFYGAVFLDAGNVWLREDMIGDDSDFDLDSDIESYVYYMNGDDLRTGKLRLKNLANDIALNTGIGLRYDLGFITLRLDWGLGLHLPYDTGRSGYFNAQTFGRDQSLHFAVGLPF